MGVDGGAPLVPELHRQSEALPEDVRQGAGLLGALTQGSVHVLGVAQDDLGDGVLLDELPQAVQDHVLPPGVDHSGISGDGAGEVGEGHAGVGVSVVNGHNAHSASQKRPFQPL